jgi:enoyl-[acyl-carrier protein] reductase II
VRVLRTEVSESFEFDTERNAMAAMVDHKAVYFDGDLSKGLAFGGQVAGRIDSVRPVAEVIRECADDCLAVIADLARRYPST